MKFFITGNGAIKAGLDLTFIVPADSVVSVFADKEQTLRQSYSIAKNIFQLVGKGEINFVLIGLMPDSLFRDENGNLTADAFKENLQVLNDYIKLCIENGAQPVGLILPVAPSIREHYRENFLNPLLNILGKFESTYNFKLLNLFAIEMHEIGFSDKTHLKEDGARLVSILLTLNLFAKKILSITDFCNMNYNYFNGLAYITEKIFFHALMEQIFSYSVKKIRNKKKLKLAFVTDHAATWCGDKLYNLFAKNDRFETTVFLCCGYESTLEDSRHDLEQFKNAGINAVGVFDLQEETPPQDVIFFLRPYTVNLSKSFQFDVLTPQTLVLHIPYGIRMITADNYLNLPIMRIAWKNFFESINSLKFHDEKCNVGVPRGLVSGQPKMDFFFEDTSKVSFPWKMTRPDAKKIIWAPHHAFNKKAPRDGYSTFPYNYRFMYEFAKAHPETSWVVKPHPRLMLEAVESGLFPSVEAYENYLQQWNDLPNAQVYSGAYYQEIFATSDGMIHDSLSFIAEYQYTHKPMIYLIDEKIRTDLVELGQKILKVSYVIDGKNLEQIAFALQKLFIEGNDPLKDARQKAFDEELNYYQLNGMDASDFIFKNISQELGL